MILPTSISRPLIYGLIFLSGVAGLIYQVAWHKYLAILLGAQARATAIVLAIFLGGISLGYWAFGRWSRWKRWNLLLIYAFVEVGLGFWAFLFPYFFEFSMMAMPQFYSVLGLNNILIDVFFSLLLIGPPTFLMGGTLPLLTQGLSEDVTEASKTHARIYGYNTVGACLGCLLAGYILIPEINLRFTVMFGGLINVSVGLVIYFLYAKWMEPQEVVLPDKNSSSSQRFSLPQITLLIIGFLSGFYILALETILIRLMGLATGASNYNFTLIVSIFILGLGIGSLLVKEIGKYSASRLFWNQVFVAFGLFLIYLSGDYWPYGVHVLRTTLRDLPQNFYFFQFLMGMGFLALLIIPIGFCGLTLPLCFHFIKDSKESLGQRVGQLYGLNTVGSVLGALLGGYFLLYYLDLDHLFKLCVVLSLITVMCAAFLYIPALSPGRMKLTAASLLFLITLVGITIAPTYNRNLNIQPFRHPKPIKNVTFKGADAFGKHLSRHTKLIYWNDGPNTSLGVGATIYKDKEVSRTVFVNGKSDGNTRGDFLTTVMLAHIPTLLAPKLDKACVIGFGTGLTIGTLNIYPKWKQIDVVEISHVIANNISYYDKYNGNVSKIKKAKIHEMDAFRFLEGTKHKYDLVISEPSNPWVAGIENLYSVEFYEIVKRKLSKGGILAQWIHTYSFNDKLFKMVLRTMTQQFKHVSVFQLKGGDFVLVGRVEPFSKDDTLRAKSRLEENTTAFNALKDAGFKKIESVFALEVIPSLATKAIAGNGEIHRLENPILSNEAAKAFFAGSSAKIHKMRRKYKEFYAALEHSLLALYLGDKHPSPETLKNFRELFCDLSQSKIRYLCEESIALSKLYVPNFVPDPKHSDVIPRRSLASFGQFLKTNKDKFTGKQLQDINSLVDTFKTYASPLARLPMNKIVSQIDYCLRTTAYSHELYGECLLQKILILETTKFPGPELSSNIQQYIEWFPSLDKKSPNYDKLQKAKEILEKMAKLTS